MNRFFTVSLALLLLLTAACAPAAPSTEPDAAPTPAPAATETPSVPAGESTPEPASEGVEGAITFYYWDIGQQPGMDAVVDIVKGKNPSLDIETTIIPWGQYWTKLQTSLPSENGPDVFWINFTNIYEYGPKGVVQELDSYVERDGIDLSPFPDALIAPFYQGGVLYGIPKDYSTTALCFNKEKFDEKGVAYPNDDWTWEDLRQAAISLTDENTYGFVVGTDPQCTLFNWMASVGVSLLSEDGTRFEVSGKPELVEASQFFVNMIFEDKCMPNGSQTAELEVEDYFQSGKAAMIISGSWMVPAYTEVFGEKLGFSLVPKKDAPANLAAGLAICISNKSQNKEAAWQLTKEFATLEGNLAQATVVTPAYAGTEETFISQYPQYPDLDVAAFTRVVPYASPWPVPSVKPALQIDEFTAVIIFMFMGESEPDAAVWEAFDQRCEEIVRTA